MQWQYKVVLLDVSGQLPTTLTSLSRIESVLNSLGLESWELVAISSHEGFLLATLKKPVI
ncbi:MAG: hypothetical protein WBB28_01695 [Crinalium sp.]